MCVNSAQSCPINKVKFFQNEILLRNMKNQNVDTNDANFQFTSQNNELLKDFTNIINLDGGVMAFSNIFTESKILIEMKISEGEPCFIPFFRNSKESLFILEKDYYLNTCYVSKSNSTILYDKRYELIDSYSKYNIYSQNKVMDSLSIFLGKSNFTNSFFPQQYGTPLATYPNNIQQSLNTNNRILQSGNISTYNITQFTTKIQIPDDFNNFYINSVYKYDFNYKLNVDLYFRNYIGMNLTCINDFKKQNILDKINYHVTELSNDIYRASDIGYYVVLAQLTLFVYNSCVYGILYYFKFTSDKQDITLYFDQYRFKFLFAALPVVLTSALNLGTGFIVTKSSVYKEPKEFFGSPLCIDYESYLFYSDIIF